MRWDEITNENQSGFKMESYLFANCLAMGMAIQRELGWSLELLYFGSMPFHVVAKNPNGHYADVRGPNLSENQVLAGFEPPVPTWEPSFQPATAAQMEEILDKHPSPGLLDRAASDLARFWGEDVLAQLKGEQR